MKEKVILSRNFRKNEVDILKEKYRLVIAEDEQMTLADAAAGNRDTVALIPFLSDHVGDEIIGRLPRLKIISNYAVGYNNIDFKRAGEAGIYVTNTPDILTDATADLTMALILGVARRIPESDRYMRTGKFSGWGANLLLGMELSGKTLGIIGLGKIGTATANRAASFGMKIIYYSRTRKEEAENLYGFEYRELEEVIASSDILSLHLPYSQDARHLFNRNTFRRMKPGAIFINVARGGLMDEEALADSLEEGRLLGAGLDVFENEPRVNSRLTKMDNVVMTPHTGSATNEARSGMGRMVIRNIGQALEGKIPENLIPELKNMVKY